MYLAHHRHCTEEDEPRERKGSRHPDSTQRSVCSAYVNCVYGKQVSVHSSSSSHRRQLAALLFTKLSLELLLMSSGEKVLCWEPQHCTHSEEHIPDAQRCYSFHAVVLSLCFLCFCSLACQESNAPLKGMCRRGKRSVVGQTGVHT